MSNCFETVSLITSYSTSEVKYIYFTVIGYPLVLMEAKEKLNVESLDIDTNLLQNPDNLLKPALTSNSRRQFYE